MTALWLIAATLFVLVLLLTFVILAHVPFFPVQTLPPASETIDIFSLPRNLLPSEEKYLVEPSEFPTLTSFREHSFDIQKALDDYHSNPVSYALGLTEISKDIYETVSQICGAEFEQLAAKESLERHWRYYAGEQTIKKLTPVSFFEGSQIFIPWFILWQAQNRKESPGCVSCNSPKDGLFRAIIPFTKYLMAGARGLVVPGPEVHITNVHPWMQEFSTFRKNVMELCRHAGSDTDILAMPSENIERLRCLAADRKREIGPLFEKNAKLTKDLEKCRRVIAALQIRHNIEQLMNELPREVYPGTTSSPKWTMFWEQVWTEAGKERIEENPFREVRQKIRGPNYNRTHYHSKGERLFADMSAEIHGYDKGCENYECFDQATQEIAKVLQPEPSEQGAEVNWTLQLERYRWLPEPEIRERLDAINQARAM